MLMLCVRVLSRCGALSFTLRELVAHGSPIEPCRFLESSAYRNIGKVETVRAESAGVEYLYHLVISLVEHRNARGVALVVSLEVG